MDALYFVVMTLTTVGFGDVTPERKGGRMFTLALCILGPLLLGRAVTSFVEMHIESIDLLDEALALHEEAKERAVAHVEDSFDIMRISESGSVTGSDDGIGVDEHDDIDDEDKSTYRKSSGLAGNDKSIRSCAAGQRTREDGHAISSAPVKGAGPQSKFDEPRLGDRSAESVEIGLEMREHKAAEGIRHTPMISPYMSPIEYEPETPCQLEGSVVDGAIATNASPPSNNYAKDMMPADFALGFLLVNGTITAADVASAAASWQQRDDMNGSTPGNLDLSCSGPIINAARSTLKAVSL